uniref:Transglutaminase-like domain-containing protein n=1 Tax=Candidatus Desulfatibia profunda TaxID=2841695 RepID=A0A8J6TM24_9BACT|nr:hypothetical protein [Candidatus Desulfatibia profunda]
MKKLKYLFLLLSIILCFSCITPKQRYGPKYISTMKGDCVDRMVVIRNDLIKQGYEVNLVVGTIIFPDGKRIGHAWVKYKDKKTGKWISIFNY